MGTEPLPCFGVYAGAPVVTVLPPPLLVLLEVLNGDSPWPIAAPNASRFHCCEVDWCNDGTKELDINAGDGASE